MSIATEITRLKNAKSAIKTSIESKGVTVGDGTLDTYASKIDEIPVGGGGGIFTGSYDAEGLSQIGWSEEEIAYYNKYGVQWNESENDAFKLTASELAGDISICTRFWPKSITRTHFLNYCCLLAIPFINTSAVTKMINMFNGCYSLTTIPLLDTSSVVSMDRMFRDCPSLTTIPLLDTSKVTNMKSMFQYCYSLKTIPLLDTSKVTDMSYMFHYCNSLKIIPELNASSVVKVNYLVNNCDALKTLGGFTNLGQAYLTTASANYSYYTLDLSSCTLLTHDSLMNVINKLYDIKTKGCNAQNLTLGSTNLAKLTSDEIAIATNKGWTVS